MASMIADIKLPDKDLSKHLSMEVRVRYPRRLTVRMHLAIQLLHLVRLVSPFPVTLSLEIEDNARPA